MYMHDIVKRQNEFFLSGATRSLEFRLNALKDRKSVV